MNDRTVTLLGTEAVEHAARSMRSSAETIERAVSSLSYALEQHQRFMDDWLQRFEQALKELLDVQQECVRRARAIERLRPLLEAVLLFHGGGMWDAARSARWEELTGSDEASTKVLCDCIRKALSNL